jgi:hypothetical protein
MKRVMPCLRAGVNAREGHFQTARMEKPLKALTLGGKRTTMARIA